MYRVVKLLGHEIYRVERLHTTYWQKRQKWVPVKTRQFDYDGDSTYEVIEYRSYVDAQDAIRRFKIKDSEREARERQDWRPVTSPKLV